MFTITVTAEQLEVIRLHLPEVAESAKAKRPSKAKSVEPSRPLVSQGDAALDAFIAAHHDPKYKPLPLPKGAAFPPSMARGGDRRPLAKVLEEAIDLAKRKGWPGTYSGNFAAKAGRS